MSPSDALAPLLATLELPPDVRRGLADPAAQARAAAARDAAEPERAARNRRTAAALQEAARTGYGRAAYALALRALSGRGRPLDAEAAAQHLRAAALERVIEAQVLLGYLLTRDDLLASPDTVEAHAWLALAEADAGAPVAAAHQRLSAQLEPPGHVDSHALAQKLDRLVTATATLPATGPYGVALTDQLAQAAAEGNAGSVAQVLARGADIDGTDVAGRTAMINAAWRGRADTVQTLAELGADFNIADAEGRTPLMWAASNGHADATRLLLEAGARPGSRDERRLTALMRAAWNGHGDVVALLLAAGADASDTAPDGATPRDLAQRGGHPDVVRLLTRAGG